MSFLKRTFKILGTLIFTYLTYISIGTFHAWIYLILALICSTTILKEVMLE